MFFTPSHQERTWITMILNILILPRSSWSHWYRGWQLGYDEIIMKILKGLGHTWYLSFFLHLANLLLNFSPRKNNLSCGNSSKFGKISHFSSSVVWKIWNSLEKFLISPTLSCIGIWNFSMSPIFLHLHIKVIKVTIIRYGRIEILMMLGLGYDEIILKLSKGMVVLWWNYFESIKRVGCIMMNAQPSRHWRGSWLLPTGGE